MHLETLTSYIVDDSELARVSLRLMAGRIAGLRLCGEFGSAGELMDNFQASPVDLLFLDIEMPGLSVFDMLDKLTPRPWIIFTTVNKDYALHAFDYDAIAYLLKPISFERFNRAVEKAWAQIALNRTSRQEEKSAVITVREKGTTFQLELAKVVRVEARGDYIRLYTDHHHYTIHGTIKALEPMLAPLGFFKVHRSHIIRLDKVEFFNGKQVCVNGELIPVSGTTLHLLKKELASRDLFVSTLAAK